MNYLVLTLGVLLVDDRAIRSICIYLRRRGLRPPRKPGANTPLAAFRQRSQVGLTKFVRRLTDALPAGHKRHLQAKSTQPGVHAYIQLAVLITVFYATLLQAPLVGVHDMPLMLTWPALALEPFRFANGYGLFAVMTQRRYEIEFQGTLDGETYVPYLFRYKPQDAMDAPGIYAPYQPRFEWNLWFASLGTWQRNRWVLRTAAALLRAEPDVLLLFAMDPFRGRRPRIVRTLMYQYWFSDWASHRTRGIYWRRALLGHYAPTLGWRDDGTLGVVAPLTNADE